MPIVRFKVGDQVICDFDSDAWRGRIGTVVEVRGVVHIVDFSDGGLYCSGDSDLHPISATSLQRDALAYCKQELQK